MKLWVLTWIHIRRRKDLLLHHSRLHWLHLPYTVSIALFPPPPQWDTQCLLLESLPHLPPLWHRLLIQDLLTPARPPWSQAPWWCRDHLLQASSPKALFFFPDFPPWISPDPRGITGIWGISSTGINNSESGYIPLASLSTAAYCTRRITTCQRVSPKKDYF